MPKPEASPIDHDLLTFLDTLLPEDREAIEALHDLLEESGLLNPNHPFSELIDLNKLAAIFKEHRPKPPPPA